MKKMILMAVLAIMGTAGAGTLTGKIVLKGSNISTSSAQVCMNGSCATVNEDGSYSLDVPSTGIGDRQGSIRTASDLYRLGQYVVSASGKRVELINMKGQRVASEDGSLDISKVPTGMYMATDGRHALKINTMSQSGYMSTRNEGMVAGVAARVSDTTSLLGVAYIVVDGDTLKEIPVTSWNLPTGYMVQRNVTVVTGTKYSGDSTQMVFWSDDSVAYVVTVVRDDGNSTTQYTGFVYNYYDSAAFASNKKVFSYFVRTYKNDSVKAYSDIKSVTAKSGNFSMDSTFFHLTTYNRTGYSYVPALDTVKKWADSTKLNYSIGVGNWVSLEDLGTTTSEWYGDSSKYAMNYMASISDTAKIYAVLRATDSIRITYSTGRAGMIDVWPYAFMGISKDASGINHIKMWDIVDIKNENPDSGSIISDTSLMAVPSTITSTNVPEFYEEHPESAEVLSAYISTTDASSIKPVPTNIKVYIHIKN